MCCLQEVGWSGHGARMLGMKGRIYNMWCSGKGDGVGGVGVMVKDLFRQMLEVRRLIDRVIIIWLF